ncbi:MAG: hypothetical protein N3B01_04260 [Verrucomicrobiae bacterium]|nr:hypothetical protein [Verrucomicrobiae bacterium]
MFRLTEQEKIVVAFILGALLLGSAVRQWRVYKAEKGGVVATEVNRDGKSKF